MFPEATETIWTGADINGLLCFYYIVV